MSAVTSRNRKKWGGLFYIAIGLFIFACALLVDAGAVTKLRFSDAAGIKMNVRLLFSITGSFYFVIGGSCLIWGKYKPAVGRAAFWASGLLLIMFFIICAGMIRRIDVVGLAAQSIRLATPIALGAMAGVMCERCGVINIAIEGMMLTGACIGFTAALYTHNLMIGTAAAVMGGMLMAAFHAVLSVRFMIDQIISGTVINILAVGVTGFIRRGMLTHYDGVSPGTFPAWNIPFLSDIPIVGKVLFSHQPMVYTMMFLIVFLHILLFHTRWGLRTRTVGEHPRAADTLGINVFTIRYVNVIVAGGIAGLGGAWFSLETVGRFDEIMTGGKGFIALAAMIFGKWTPAGAFGGALLFGAADAFQIKLQISGLEIPYQFLSMTPYIVTMIVLAGIIGRAIPPAADGVPYKREG